MLTGCIDFRFASAGSGAVHDIDSFGIGGADANVAIADSADFANVSEVPPRESTVLTSTASRDISQGIRSYRSRGKKLLIAAEEAARAEEEARIAAAEQAKAEQGRRCASMQPPMPSPRFPKLVFLPWAKRLSFPEWTSRINAYQPARPWRGKVPRSPKLPGATASTRAGRLPYPTPKSSKGAHCFPCHYNAWGWGDKSWSSWEEAINAHVAGLANGYGYSITYANAAKYCPPNTDHWFRATIGQMKMI